MFCMEEVASVDAGLRTRHDGLVLTHTLQTHTTEVTVCTLVAHLKLCACTLRIHIMEVVLENLEEEVDMHFGTKLMCRGQDGTKSVAAPHEKT